MTKHICLLVEFGVFLVSRSEQRLAFFSQPQPEGEIAIKSSSHYFEQELIRYTTS